ncbi:MAG: DUF169 domain-containing protein [Thermodesulfobacteriota bacterium]|nr:DUF169 domain-containing protein [Thermodesulfobacteriota bacterium]
MKGLRLETAPVAVQFSTKPPEKVALFQGRKKACEMLDVARLDRKVFYTTAENHTCRNGRFYLGMSKPFAGLKTGDWNAGKYPDKGRSMYPSPVVFRRTLDHYLRIKSETVKVISYAPLDNCPFDIQMGGVIVVLTCTPKQGLYLARSATYEMGGVVKGITGPSTCSIVMAGPFQKGEMFTTLGCYGGRLFVKIKTEEEYIGFPIEFLGRIVHALEAILRDRPDLNRLIDEGVGVYHEATEEELNNQIVKGDMATMPD